MTEFFTQTRDSFPTRALHWLIELLVGGMKGESLTAAAEARELNGAVRSTFAARPAKRLDTLSALRALRDGAHQPQTESGTSDLKRPPPPIDGPDLLRARANEASPGRVPSAPVSDEELRDIAREIDTPIRPLSTAGLDQLSAWINDFASRRNVIVQRLVAHYPSNANLMLTPAWVDYSRWLKIEPGSWREPSSLVDQIAVSAALTKAWARGQIVGGIRRQVLFSGFAPFDPARCMLRLKDDPDPVAVLNEALASGKIIGCKVYPPMGFKPFENGSKSERYPDLIATSSSDVGSELDHHLERFFEICVKHDAPVLAHCAHSNYTDSEYGFRADPRHWLKLVLTKYPKLRINLGHFGGVWSFGDEGISDKNKSEKGRLAKEWATVIADTIENDPDRYPNVYVDISYASTFLPYNYESEDRKAVDFLKQLVATHKVMRKRILYGSDWQMIGMEHQQLEYATLVETGFTEILGAETMNDFRAGNAARFLGLRRGHGSYRRLAGFLGKENQDLLDRFAYT